MCQKQVSRTGTSNYIPQCPWDVITCPCPWYLLLTYKSPYMLPHSLAARMGIILTHWDRVPHICVGKLTIIGSDNGLSPGRCQVIVLTNAGILVIGPLGTNFSEILIEIQTFSLKKIRLKMLSAKCCQFRLGLNVLTNFERHYQVKMLFVVSMSGISMVPALEGHYMWMRLECSHG